MDKARVVIRVAAATFLIGCALWFLAFPGVLVHRDMVIVDTPALSAWNFGTAPGHAARNAPQDGVLAVVGLVVPASWVARLILVGSAVGACVASCRFAQGAVNEVAAMAVLIWNPFVVERLLQGHWTVVAAFWLLPLVASLKNRPGFQAITMWATSLTPTGAIAGAAVGIATGRKKIMVLVAVAMSLPWLIPSLLHRPVAAATDVFRPSSLWELVGLGGIWNAEARPSLYVPLLGIALLAFLLTAAPRADRALLALAGVGFALALASLLPLGDLYATIPGVGLLRDGQKWLLLASPALCQLAGNVRWPALVIALTIFQVPSLPQDVAALHPVPEDASWYEATAPVPTMTLVDGHPALNPALKASPIPPSGELVVDGTVVERASDAPPPSQAEWDLGLGLTLWWMVLPAVIMAFYRRPSDPGH
ncbi:hypothetical protein [uncultured Corynebacterium sp.]|uniref:hypothetical protein n=1 Tax=uncultured Corynebacterium sp. TaxID=159447 RepID=UPI002630464B|nr:hypothetical protein [uncultured Corynebacterium sp.]